MVLNQSVAAGCLAVRGLARQPPAEPQCGMSCNGVWVPAAGHLGSHLRACASRRPSSGTGWPAGAPRCGSGAEGRRNVSPIAHCRFAKVCSGQRTAHSAACRAVEHVGAWPADHSMPSGCPPDEAQQAQRGDQAQQLRAAAGGGHRHLREDGQAGQHVGPESAVACVEASRGRPIYIVGKVVGGNLSSGRRPGRQAGRPFLTCTEPSNPN